MSLKTSRAESRGCQDGDKSRAEQTSHAEQGVLRGVPCGWRKEWEEGGRRQPGKGGEGRREKKGGGGGEEERREREEMEGGKDPRTQRALHSPVLYTCSCPLSSLPPPNTTMSSLIATARWPWRGRGTGLTSPPPRSSEAVRALLASWREDTAEAIVPGKGAVEKSRQVGREPPNSAHI